MVPAFSDIMYVITIHLISVEHSFLEFISGSSSTSRNAYTRGKEHSKSLSNKEERSALWKHCREKHSSSDSRALVTRGRVVPPR